MKVRYTLCLHLVLVSLGACRMMFAWRAALQPAAHLTEPPLVVENDRVTVAQIKQLVSSGVVHHIVISPGPGTPSEPHDIGERCPAAAAACPSIPAAVLPATTCTLAWGSKCYFQHGMCIKSSKTAFPS